HGRRRRPDATCVASDLAPLPHLIAYHLSLLSLHTAGRRRARHVRLQRGAARPPKPSILNQKERPPLARDGPERYVRPSLTFRSARTPGARRDSCRSPSTTPAAGCPSPPVWHAPRSRTGRPM